MNRSSKLQPVQRVNDTREQEAARAFGSARHYLEQLEHQYDELQNYREEYRHHFLHSGRLGMRGKQVQQQQLFLANLDRAIEQQREAISQAKSECERRQQRWFAAKGRSRALDRVVERYREEELVLENRREQKDTDELAATRALQQRK
ncbi:MAG: flagellar export protein FliJ [Chromatiales bacterium]|nr:flagellar export protein FliJ [Chromatiales bacterium]